MTLMVTSKRASMHLRLPTTLVERIKRAAADDHRSVQNWVEVTLTHLLGGLGNGNETRGGDAGGSDDRRVRRR